VETCFVISGTASLASIAAFVPKSNVRKATSSIPLKTKFDTGEKDMRELQKQERSAVAPS